MSGFEFVDFLRVNPDPQLVDLSMRDKVKFIDAALKANQKGLVVTIDVSHSGRRINNRIYPRKGQKQVGVRSATHPFPKPLLKYHPSGGGIFGGAASADDQDAIGRFAKARYIDLGDEISGFFPRPGDLKDLLAAFDADDHQKAFDLLQKRKLLVNDKWPGVGKIQADVRVLDEEAIEKFLDGRYITVSAGSSTNRFLCTTCWSDWAKGDWCDHSPGRSYEIDGEDRLCLGYTGDFVIRELSVVNTPADDLAQVVTVHATDAEGAKCSFDESFRADPTHFFLTDALCRGPEEVLSEDIEETPPEESRGTDEIDAAPEDLSGEARVPVLDPNDTTQPEVPPVLKFSDAALEQISQVIKDQVAQEVQKLKDSLPVPVEAVLESTEDSVPKTDHDALQEDLARALQDLEQTRSRLEEVLVWMARERHHDFSQVDESERLENLYGWFGTLDVRADLFVPPRVDNPSQGSSESRDSKLGGYNQKVIARYRELRDSQGEDAANLYIQVQKSRGYIPKGFDPQAHCN